MAIGPVPLFILLTFCRVSHTLPKVFFAFLHHCLCTLYVPRQGRHWHTLNCVSPQPSEVCAPPSMDEGAMVLLIKPFQIHVSWLCHMPPFKRAMVQQLSIMSQQSAGKWRYTLGLINWTILHGTQNYKWSTHFTVLWVDASTLSATSKCLPHYDTLQEYFLNVASRDATVAVCLPHGS